VKKQAKAKSGTNPKVDWFFDKAGRWEEAVRALRDIALGFPFAEELKWGCPCYTLDGANVVLIHTFKEYCALLFMKGALLKDPKGLLIQQTKNVQAARQLRFGDAGEIAKLKPAIQSLIREAIAVEKSGAKVELKKTSEFEVPEEFVDKLDDVPNLKAAFDALTPGRQRAYLLFFSSAKQSRTRVARIEKCIPAILKGKGLND
jgi:uncharacterized protein YdeI (YjbR/CyaY-like superfamily)